MVSNREYEGKDLEEALHLAAAELGISEPELDYEIIEQGRPGLFGLGAKNVRIRVMPPVSRVPHAEQGEAAAPAARDAAAGPEAEGVCSTVQRMLDLMGLELSAKARPESRGLSLELDGPDRDLLAQKDGELASALQLLLNRMSRRAWPEAGRIHIYCNGQRGNRDEDVVALARSAAKQVTRTGRSKRLRQMNAYERRLVHVTVREVEGVGSRSEGDGYLKRVRIFKQRDKSGK